MSVSPNLLTPTSFSPVNCELRHFLKGMNFFYNRHISIFVNFSDEKIVYVEIIYTQKTNFKHKYFLAKKKKNCGKILEVLWHWLITNAALSCHNLSFIDVNSLQTVKSLWVSQISSLTEIIKICIRIFVRDGIFIFTLVIVMQPIYLEGINHDKIHIGFQIQNLRETV